VLISKLSKAEAAKAYNQQIENLIFTNSTIIYTDASSMEEGKGIGVGVIVYDHSDWDKTKVYQENLNIGPSQLVYNGELEGVTRTRLGFGGLKPRPTTQAKTTRLGL
jgi:hypothetical protein